MSPDEALKLLTQGSPLVLLAFFILASYFQLVVLGPFYQAVVKDRDDWKKIAQAAADTAKEQAIQISKLTEVTENLTDALGRRAGRS
jgi:hypothetical protein